ncbi:PP2C family protein-serine/threonine phosphatase [Nocardioides sp.]|uniref:PP2C family protein-serine/threonine phosphatase n=1 Tax=Nocardioides sp. TaxID=35761 RepID=UPI003D107707
MSEVELRYAGATDVGLVRDHNEDAWLASPPVFVVADGMGGHHGGDVASGIVVEEFARLAGTPGPLGAAEVSATLESCQRRILEYAAAHGAAGPGQWYAGTTVAAAVLVEDQASPRWLLVNLGDSRIYRLHDDQLVQVSVDHSVVQELLDAGLISEAEAETHPDRHVITRALGGPELPPADVWELPVGETGRLLLCSDGVSGLVSAAELARLLAASPDPAAAAEGIVAAALAAGGTDNATAVVIDVVGWPT